MGLLSLAEDVLAAGSGPERLRVRARRRAECTNERQAAEQARPRRGRPPEGKHAHAVPSLTCVLDRTSLRSELTPCHQAQPCAVCGVARAPYASAGVDLTLGRPCCGCGAQLEAFRRQKAEARAKPLGAAAQTRAPSGPPPAPAPAAAPAPAPAGLAPAGPPPPPRAVPAPPTSQAANGAGGGLGRAGDAAAPRGEGQAAVLLTFY